MNQETIRNSQTTYPSGGDKYFVNGKEVKARIGEGGSTVIEIKYRKAIRKELR